MKDDLKEVVLYEIRQNRQEIKRTREEFIRARSFLYGATTIISGVSGFLGSWLHKVGFFK